MTELLTLETELKNEIMTTIRLTTGGVSSLAGLSYDDGEDCKVCVTESLLLLSHGGFARAKLAFYLDDGLQVKIVGSDRTDKQCGEGDEISVALLSALAEGVSLEKSGGSVFEISFHFTAK